MIIYDTLWNNMGYMLPYVMSCYFMWFYGTLWYLWHFLVMYGFHKMLWYLMAPYSALWSSMAFYDTILYFMSLQVLIF